jgi:hypothetical protein
MPTSVSELLQEQLLKQIKALTLDEVERNVLVCNRAFTASDIRPGAYLTPEGRQIGKCTNERDEWGYKWQVTVIRGASGGRSQDMAPWMFWLQQIVREFNHKRLAACITSINYSRACEARDIKPTLPEGRDRDYDIAGVEIVVWVFESRT